MLRLFILSLFLSTTVSTAEELRNWNSRDGKFSVKATVEKLGDDHVTLKRSDDGKTVRVPIDRLSDENQTYLESVRESDTQESGDEATTPVLAAESAEPASNADEIRIESDGEKTIRLIPFCEFESPSPTFQWRVASTDPPVFAGTAPAAGKAMVVTVVPGSPDQEHRATMMKATYNALIQQLQTGGKKVRGTQLDLEKEIADVAQFYLSSNDSDDRTLHVMTEMKFQPKQTFIFQTTAQSQQEASSLLSAAKTFKPLAANSSGGIPEDIVHQINARVEEMTQLVKSGETETLLQQMIPPDVFKKLKADSSKWDSIVQNFNDRKAGELLIALGKMDWSKAKLETIDNVQTVSFPIKPKAIAFQKSGKKWNLRN